MQKLRERSTMTKNTTAKNPPKVRIMSYREFFESRKTEPSKETIIENSKSETKSRQRAKIVLAAARNRRKTS